MPSVQSLFGAEAPVMNVKPPTDHSPVKRATTGLDIRLLTEKEGQTGKAGNVDNARSFYRNGSSIRSGCFDSTSSEDEGTVIEGTDSSSNDELMDSSYLRFEEEELEKQKTVDEKMKEWKGEWSSRTRHGTFEKLRRTWETQRDLLLESLKEKDDIIENQREMLHSSTKQLMEMEASIDALETRFSREIAAFRLKVEQHEQRSLKKAESMLDTRDEIERGQSKMKKDLRKFGLTVQKDIQTLDNALHQQTSLYTQSEQEKQAVTERLDASNAKLEDLREQVRCLTAELSLNKSKSSSMQRSESHELPRPPKEKVQMSPSFDSAQTSKCGKEMDALKRENVQLKREVFEIRERLIDLKEHSEELESQVYQQEEALNEAWSQQQELELLKMAKQDNEALLAARQKVITGLKQSLTHMQSICQGKEASEDTKIFEEILAAHQRNEEMEKLLINTQSERDVRVKQMHKLEGTVRSMGKQSKEIVRATERLKKEQTDLKKTLNCKNSEIATLQTNLRVETLKRTSSVNNSKKSHDDRELNEDLIKELLKSKVSLAEMSELVIQLRHKVASLKNKLRSGRTKYG